MNLKNKLISIFSLIILAGLLSLVPGVNKSSQQAQIISSLKQESIIEQTQIKLKELGYYGGEINNKFNIKTRLALIKYQKDNNIRQTGKLDRETQKLLLGIDLYRENRESPNIVTGVLGGWVFEEFDEDLRIINDIHQYYIERPDGSIEIIPEEFYDHDHDDKKSPGGHQDYKGSERELDYSIFLEENLGKEISLNKETKEFTLIEKSNERDFIVRPGGPGYREGRAAVFLVTFEEANVDSINYNVQAQDDDPNGNILSGPPSNPPVRPAPEDVQSYLFDQDNGQFQKFYNEMSHGKVTYTGDVFGWYEMPGDGDDPEYQGVLGPCSIRRQTSGSEPDFRDKMQQMVDYYNVDITEYNTIIILTECDEYNNVGGFAYLNPDGSIFPGNEYFFTEIKGHPTRFSFTGPSDYINFPDYVGILNHEIGHTFKLPHAVSLDCVEDTISLGCSYSIYGNPFDRMGYPDGANIFNLRAQVSAGWINPGQILRINQSGSYYIDNLQTENGVVGAYINYPGTDRPIFSVEHRKGEGFDSKLIEYAPLFNDVLNGLILYKNFPMDYLNPNVNLFSSFFNTSSVYAHFQIVDPNPTQDPIYDDLKYDAITGNFLDPVTGIEINVTNVTPDGIYFDVGYNLQTSECNYDIPINQIFSNISINSYSLSLDGYYNSSMLCLPKAYKIYATDVFSEQIIEDLLIFDVQQNESFYKNIDLDSGILLQSLNPGDQFSINLEIEDLQTGEIQPVVYQGTYIPCGYNYDISQILSYSIDEYGLNIDGLFSEIPTCNPKVYEIRATDQISIDLFGPTQTLTVLPNNVLVNEIFEFDLGILLQSLNPGDQFSINLEIEDLQTGEIQPVVYQNSIPQCNFIEDSISSYSIENQILANTYNFDPEAQIVPITSDLSMISVYVNFDAIQIPTPCSLYFFDVNQLDFRIDSVNSNFPQNSINIYNIHPFNIPLENSIYQGQLLVFGFLINGPNNLQDGIYEIGYSIVETNSGFSYNVVHQVEVKSSECEANLEDVTLQNPMIGTLFPPVSFQNYLIPYIFDNNPVAFIVDVILPPPQFYLCNSNYPTNLSLELFDPNNVWSNYPSANIGMQIQVFFDLIPGVGWPIPSNTYNLELKIIDNDSGYEVSYPLVIIVP